MTQPNFISANTPLSNYTSWQVGGKADFLALPKTLDQLIEAQGWAQKQGLAIHVIGGGSNVLISDKGLRGLSICLKYFAGTEVEVGERVRITAMSGSGKSELLKIFLKHKLAPALFMAGLPGDVGGGVVMNAGVAENFVPREFTEITDWVEVLKPDGSLKIYQHADLKWVYRHSSGWQPGIITRVGMSWPNEPDVEILARVKDANRSRLSKQPLDMPSCGSVFRNPEGHKAAQLIDSSGLKGFQIGDAQVSMKHANFIVNLGEAQASEIWQVIQHVKKTVKEKKGVDLQTEVVLMGDWNKDVL